MTGGGQKIGVVATMASIASFLEAMAPLISALAGVAGIVMVGFSIYKGCVDMKLAKRRLALDEEKARENVTD